MGEQKGGEAIELYLFRVKKRGLLPVIYPQILVPEQEGKKEGLRSFYAWIARESVVGMPYLPFRFRTTYNEPRTPHCFPPSFIYPLPVSVFFVMAVLMSPYSKVASPLKRRRRTATSVLAGDFDPRPARYVLTSLLNGVPINAAVEIEERSKRAKKKDKRAKDRERKRAKAQAARELKASGSSVVASSHNTPVPGAGAHSHTSVSAPVARSLMARDRFSSAAQQRPSIHIASMQRSVSITPPPRLSSPVSTPGPSISSSTSHASSKRPLTPDDEEDIPTPRREPPKKRPAVKKGWKGWVEGSPPPSEKLINLDSVPVLHERKTRSGKAFDGVGQGKDWV